MWYWVSVSLSHLVVWWCGDLSPLTLWCGVVSVVVVWLQSDCTLISLCGGSYLITLWWWYDCTLTTWNPHREKPTHKEMRVQSDERTQLLHTHTENTPQNAQNPFVQRVSAYCTQIETSKWGFKPALQRGGKFFLWHKGIILKSRIAQKWFPNRIFGSEIIVPKGLLPTLISIYLSAF